MKKKKKLLFNPHDVFFSALFRYREVAVEFVKKFLPSEIVSEINFSHFEIDQNTYLSEDLKRQYSDMVYRTRLRTGGVLRVVILFEHKSMMPKKDYPLKIQLLNYQTGIWRTDRSQKRPHTFVLPVVLYHGERPWKEAPFWSIFDGLPEAWRKYAVRVPYYLIDLEQYTDENLSEAGEETFLGTGLLCLKHSHDPAFFNTHFEKLLNFVWVNWSPEKITSFLLHLSQYIEKVSQLTMKEIVEDNLREMFEHLVANPRPSFIVELEEKVRSEAKREGRVEGRVEGMEEGMEKKATLVVKALLKEFPNFSNEKIALLTVTEVDFVKKIREGFTEADENSPPNE